MKFFDTNVFLSHLDIVKEEEIFLLSSVTFTELEEIKSSCKKSEDVKHAARKAVRFLEENISKYNVIIYDLNVKCDFLKYALEDTPDNRIIRCAEYAKSILGYNDLIFVSNDILCRMIAQKYFGLDVEGDDDNKEEIYKGYKIICGSSEEINNLMNEINYSDWNVNEYLIIQNTDDNSEKEMRFDGEKFAPLKLPSSKFIKAKNSLQRCVLDALFNPEITIVAILGTFGSGKTYMAMQMGLYEIQEKGNQSKLVGIREIIGEGKEPGYLPGDLDSKVRAFFDPLAHSLKGGIYELESLKQSGVLETNIPHFMKGITYSHSIILCDEAEDLSAKQIRLIGTRLGEGSRIFFSGDYKQSLIDSSDKNALIEMCEKFKGNQKFACVCLDEDVRSETSKMFAELM